MPHLLLFSSSFRIPLPYDIIVSKHSPKRAVPTGTGQPSCLHSAHPKRDRGVASPTFLPLPPPSGAPPPLPRQGVRATPRQLPDFFPTFPAKYSPPSPYYQRNSFISSTAPLSFLPKPEKTYSSYPSLPLFLSGFNPLYHPHSLLFPCGLLLCPFNTNTSSPVSLRPTLSALSAIPLFPPSDSSRNGNSKF